jgi:hypothetical protein
MSYQIKKADGTTLITLNDGLTDKSSSSLTLVGKNVSNFGQIQNENFVYLLENFANSTPPVNQTRGQLWYDITTHLVKFYDGGIWQSLAVLDFQNTQPPSSHEGHLWFDTSKNQLYINSGTDTPNYILVGPENVAGFGVTRMVSTKLLGVDSFYHPVIKIVINDEVVGIISTDGFFINSSNSIPGFTQIFRGINTKYNSNDFPLVGRAFNSNLATTATNLQAGALGSIPYQQATGITGYIPIGGNRNILFSNGSYPEWKSLDTLSISKATTATNLEGGLQGSLPYQTGPGQTNFVNLAGTVGYVLTSGASRPVWTNPSDLSVTSAVNSNRATTATYAESAPWNGLTGTRPGLEYFSNDTTQYITANSAMPVGSIIMWYGTQGSIPQYWHICDGTSGTPDLRNTFVVGASADNGSRPVTSITGPATYTETGGSKDASLVAHSHDTETTVINGAHYHVFPGDDQLSFATGVAAWGGVSDGTFSYDARSSGGGGGQLWRTTDAQTNVSAVTQITSSGSPSSNANLPPYRAMYYIMKIA